MRYRNCLRPVEPKLQTAHLPTLRHQVEEWYDKDLDKRIASCREKLKERMEKVLNATCGSDALSSLSWSEDAFETAANLELLEVLKAYVEKKGWAGLKEFREWCTKRAVDKAGSTSQSTSTLSNLAERHMIAASIKHSGQSWSSGTFSYEYWEKAPITVENAKMMQEVEQVKLDQKYAAEMTEYKVRLAEYKQWKKTGEMPKKPEVAGNVAPEDAVAASELNN